MKLSEKIQEILDSSITSYRISKMSGVTESSIGAMRRGDRKISNMQLGVAEKLGDFYDKEIATMTKEGIEILLSSTFKKINIEPFIDTDDNAVIAEVELSGDDDPVRFVVYQSKGLTETEVIQDLGQAMRGFDHEEEGRYYPGMYSDQANDKQNITAEYMGISKESADYLTGLGKKILKLK